MLIFIYIGIIIIYFIILALAIYELITSYICDDHACLPFTRAFNKPNRKAIIIHLLTKLCEESLWPFAYIASSIIMFLLMAILPLPLSITFFILIFLISFISFYCIIGFLVFHYVKPIKDYIIEFINDN